MPQQIVDTLSNADATPQGIDGGLNLKADPTRLAPPNTTRSDNAHYDGIGNVSQLPGFVSSGLNSARHVYNLHAKDIAIPSSSGDILVHGEFPDDANGYTIPTWAHANGTATSYNQQPVLPFTARTRYFGARFRTDSTILWRDTMSIQFARQEGSYAEGQRGYIAFDANSSKFIAGKCNGLTNAFNSSTIVSAPAELIGVQNTGQFAFVYAQSGSLFNDTYTANLTKLSTTTLSSNAKAVLDDGHTSIAAFNHAGATFVAYVTTDTRTLNFYDLTNSVNITTNISANPINGAFAVFSPYSHSSTTGASFLCVVINNYLHVLCRATPTATTMVVVNAVQLPLASQQPTNTTKYLQATGCAIVNDSQGGVNGGAKLLITLFRSYPESTTGFSGSFSYYAHNAISVDQYAFTANATPTVGGTLTNLKQTVLRPPGGAVVVAKAFASNPSETYNAGATQAKQALCLIKTCGWESTIGYTYGQPTYYLLDQAGRVCGRFCEGSAYTTGTYYSKDGGSSNVNVALPDNRLQTLASPLFLLGSDAGTDTAAFSVVLPVMSLTSGSQYPAITDGTGLTTFTTQPNNPTWTPTAITLTLPSANNSIPAVQAGPYTVVSGPLTCVHDGGQIVEANFHMACPNLIVVPITSGTQRGTAGNYYYVGVLEWRDELGQLHRSAPSLPAACARPSAPFYGATVYCPFPMSSKPYNNIVFKLYRSINNRLNDSNYYLVASSAGATSSLNFGMFMGAYDALYNDAAALTDASPNPSSLNAINAQARLYTSLGASSSGKVYASTPPPPFIWQTAHRGRLFGLAQVGGQFQFVYSSPTSQQIAPEWNSFNYLPIPTDIGDARSIEALDSFVYVFGTRYNMSIAGDGPATSNSTGVPNPGDNYTQVTPIPTPAGVIGSGSPSRVPDGIVFQGYSGVQLINRSSQIEAIGAPVDVLTGRQTGNVGTVFGRAVTLPSLQSVVWPNASGPALVYSYLTKKFSTWPLFSNACSLVQKMDGTIIGAIQPIIANQYLGPASVGAQGCDLGSFSATTYAPIYVPNAMAPGLVIETPWILPHGTSGGEARVWNGCITGTWLGPHILQIEQAYDYEAYTLTRTVDFSTSPRRYQVIAQPRANTRCVAIRFRLTLLPVVSIASSYAMATLSDFVLFSAQQQGTTRTSANLRS